MDTIVVGVDGSKGSGEAMSWELDEGKLRGDARETVDGRIAPSMDVDVTSLAIGSCGGRPRPG